MSLQVDDDAHKSRVKVENAKGVMKVENVKGVMKVKNVMDVMEVENVKKVKVEKVKAENVEDEEVENKPGSPNSIHTISMNLSAKPPVAEKFAAGSVLDTAVLQKGPEGKVVAFFDGVPHTFETPNMVLDKVLQTDGQPRKRKPSVRKTGNKVKKGKKGNKVKKVEKPMKAKGTKIAKNSNANVENPVGVLPVKPSYGVMYYKKGHTIGIRLKNGSKKQVFGLVAEIPSTRTSLICRWLGKRLSQ